MAAGTVHPPCEMLLKKLNMPLLGLVNWIPLSLGRIGGSLKGLQQGRPIDPGLSGSGSNDYDGDEWTAAAIRGKGDPSRRNRSSLGTRLRRVIRDHSRE